MKETMLTKIKALQNEEGFTLIELLVVIVIIGILAAIALPIFLNQQKAAADAATKSDIRTMNTTIQTELVRVGGDLSKLPANSLYIYRSNPTNTGLWPVGPGQVTQGTDAMKAVNLSADTRMGVRVSDPKIGYCIIAGNNGGTYDLGGTDLPGIVNTRTLFYDSATGKLTDSSQLTTTGACSPFKS